MSFQKNSRPSVTIGLVKWSVGLLPSAEDLALADRALLDTVSVGPAAPEEPILDIVAVLPEEAHWAAACHIIDFDDLHMPSTTHTSTVCAPVALSLGSGARSHLAGAVPARVGTALGWPHYAAGWHATTTPGAIGAAAGAAVALGLDAEGVGRAMALAVPAAGGLQRSFGSDGRSLQIGFAAHAGVRAEGHRQITDPLPAADRAGGQVQAGVRRRGRAARARRGAHRRRVRRSILADPAGSPQNPATEEDLRLKVADCLAGIPVQPDDITWASAADLLRSYPTQQGD